MMKKCPFCMEEIPEESRVCKFCNSTVVKKCPFCAEEVMATARKCRFCQSDLTSPTGEGPSKPTRSRMRPDAVLGEERPILMTLLLTFLTCGIWGFVVIYKMGEELNAHLGRQEVNPGLDLVLIFLTCGIWWYVLMYRYPKVFHEVTIEEEMPPVDLTVPCLLLTIFGLPIVALLILQSELNKHWEAHQTLRRAGM